MGLALPLGKLPCDPGKLLLLLLLLSVGGKLFVGGNVVLAGTSSFAKSKLL